jgi:hypothetical protein
LYHRNSNEKALAVVPTVKELCMNPSEKLRGCASLKVIYIIPLKISEVSVMASPDTSGTVPDMLDEVKSLR